MSTLMKFRIIASIVIIAVITAAVLLGKSQSNTAESSDNQSSTQPAEFNADSLKSLRQD